MGRHDRKRDALRSGINADGGDGPRRHGEREPPCLAKQRQLRRCEALRVQIREGLAFDRGAEVQEGGVARPGQGERRAEQGEGLDPLVLGGLEGPAWGHDLAQQR